MSALINIGSVTLPVVEYRGERVVTLAMVDQAHQRPEGTAGRNFREHRERFIEGEDYFELTADEIRRQSLVDAFPPRTAKGIILTESGYLMLVKSFADDLAWDVQRKLVRSYFAKTSHTAKPQSTAIDTTIEAAKLFKPMFQIARLIGCDKNAAAISANQGVVQVTGTNMLALLGHTHLEAENQDSQYFTPSELGARISVSGAKLNQQLAAAGLQVRQGKGWEPTQTGKEFSRIFDTGKKHGSGTPIQQIKWAATVMDAIAR